MNQYANYSFEKIKDDHIERDFGNIPFPKLIDKGANIFPFTITIEEILILLFIIMLIGEDRPDFILIGMLLFLIS